MKIRRNIGISLLAIALLVSSTPVSALAADTGTVEPVTTTPVDTEVNGEETSAGEGASEETVTDSGIQEKNVTEDGDNSPEVEGAEKEEPEKIENGEESVSTDGSDNVINSSSENEKEKEEDIVGDPAKVKSVTLDKTSLTLFQPGDSAVLTSRIEMEDTASQSSDIKAAWNSSNTGVVTVDANGKITAVAKGNADVTAMVGDKSAVCHVTVGIDILYRTHVQSYGWQGYVQNGALAGTTGQAKRLEAIQIKVQGDEKLGVRYRTHVQTYGWQNFVQNDALAGTTGQAKRLEAIQIELTGEDASLYDVYYCVHVQSYGWQPWVKNGAAAGTTGRGKRLEGIEIQIRKKGSAAPANLDSSGFSSEDTGVTYDVHCQTYGWMNAVSNGATAGTTGQAKRLEAIHISLTNPKYNGSIQYRTHVQTYGWMGWVGAGGMSGTSGQAKRLEAIQIELTGEIASHYNVWYRTHVQKVGWTGWAKNGASCGSQGLAYRMEAIQIKILPSSMGAPGSTANSFVNRTVTETNMISKAQGYSSPTGYLLLVNKPSHKVMVLTGSRGNWRETKYFTCVVGKPSTPTVEGEFNVGSKMQFFWTGGNRCWYATQITGDYLFHSVIYDSQSSPARIVDASMGVSASHGCVRLSLENAKWIYDNVPHGSKIVIYH